MPRSTLLGALAIFAVIAYGVLAGADFGGGIWDIAARGARREAQQKSIARAMGPVWEANHVWLIFLIVILFSAFPSAYAALSIALFWPFHLILLGISLRGGAFVFRAHGNSIAGTSLWGGIFGGASIITPVLLGMCLGAVSSGDIRVRDAVVSAPLRAWTSPICLVVGLLALAICAYLAAVYLTNETEGELQEVFRRKALLAGTFVVALAIAAFPLTRSGAPHLYAGLTAPRSAGVLAAGILAALTSGFALLTRRYRLARRSAIVQVVFLLGGWGLAQFPFILYPDVTLSGAASPEATLGFVLYSIPAGALLIVPSMWLLFDVFKRPRSEPR